MKVEQTYTAQVTVAREGDQVYRLTQWDDSGYPMWSLDRATVQICDDGNAETGPMVSEFLGEYSEICSGMGYVTVESALEQFNHEEWQRSDG